MALAINSDLIASSISNTLNNLYASIGQSVQNLSTSTDIGSVANNVTNLATNRSLLNMDIALMKQALSDASDLELAIIDTYV